MLKEMEPKIWNVSTRRCRKRNKQIGELYLCFAEMLVMVIGGWTEDGLTNDIELVSLDSSPVPECLSTLSPFPYGGITESAGAAIASGMKRVVCRNK